MTPKPAVSIQNVDFSYGGLKVLNGISLDIASGEFLGIVGPNAGGKSTLLKLILGLLKPTRGKISVLGEKTAKARTRIGYVPQYPKFAHEFPITVEQTVLMARLGSTRLWGGYTPADKTIAAKALAETESLPLKKRRLNSLSGGQLQRVLLSRALACEPEILILDEPTSNLDQRVETEIFDLLKSLNERMTIIVVSHDIAFVSAYVGRVACLNQTLVCHEAAHIDGKLLDSLYGTHVHAVEHSHD